MSCDKQKPGENTDPILLLQKVTRNVNHMSKKSQMINTFKLYIDQILTLTVFPFWHIWQQSEDLYFQIHVAQAPSLDIFSICLLSIYSENHIKCWF